MKLVINRQYGGFSLSHKAVMRYAELKGITLYPYIDDITKQVYGDRATLDNIENLPFVHYSTAEAKNERTLNDSYFSTSDIPRDDPALIQVVQELGDAANVDVSTLSIVEIPDGTEWEIEEYDGMEWVAEKHRTWG